MNKFESIVHQYNHSQRNDKFLKELQGDFIKTGSHVVSFNNTDFIIQKCPELLYKIVELTNLQKDLLLLFQRSPQVLIKLTINKLLEDELVQTNSIEQIHTDRKSVRELLNGTNLTKKPRETQIVKHYTQILNENIKIEKAEDISHLYYSFLEDYINQDDLDHMGEYFRAESVNVVTEKNKVIHSGIDGEKNIYDSVESILNYLNNSDENIFIKISAFHYFFGYIHPFYDGNGRMIRLLTSAKLYPELSIASLAISDVISQNLSTYYKMFDQTNSPFNVNDITYFVYTFVGFIIEATNTTIYHLNQNTQKIEHFNRLLDNLSVSTNELLCLSIIYQASLLNITLSQKQLKSELNISSPTLKKYIDNLSKAGYLNIDQSRKPNIITLDQTWLNSILSN